MNRLDLYALINDALVSNRDCAEVPDYIDVSPSAMLLVYAVAPLFVVALIFWAWL